MPPIELTPDRWIDEEIELAERGRIHVIRSRPVEGRPTVALLHGLAATGRLNWYTAFDALAERYNVVAVDHRGHGRGIRTGRFRLRDCADDAVAVLDHLGMHQRFVAVGYSMGGPIAKLCWKRHSDRVGGLVLCATASHFMTPRLRALISTVVPGAVSFARVAPKFVADRIVDAMIGEMRDGPVRDAVEEEMRRMEPATVLQAVRAVVRFSSHDWVHRIDVPTAVVITNRDDIVPTKRQRRLAGAIPGAMQIEIDGDHVACVTSADQFVPALVSGCQHAVGGLHREPVRTAV